MTAPPRSRRVVVPDDVLMQRLPDDESVFLNLATEQYYGLNATGTAMWLALTETGSVDRASGRLLDEFDVDDETLHRDLDDFIRRVAEWGLIQFVDP